MSNTPQDNAADPVASAPIREALSRRTPMPTTGVLSEAGALIVKTREAERVFADNSRILAGRRR
jgi:hypothetical protein